MLKELIRKRWRAEHAQRTRQRLPADFDRVGGHAWIARGVSSKGEGDSNDRPFHSSLVVLEDGVPLLGAHAAHQSVCDWGAGIYCHWEDDLILSTRDNSDPNHNGRRYEIEWSLTLEEWNRERLRKQTALWDFHPDAAYFKSRGGTEIPPPVYCSLALTNKCNLRCEICGSQKFLDENEILRRNMDTGLFLEVARTVFPFVVEVELNSQGDPLLHPDIETVFDAIAAHGCDLKLQTNGTLFSDSVIDKICQHYGTVMVSLDAVGAKFDEVRRGGVWAKAEPQLLKFLRKRDPSQLRVGLYPTVTGRTVGEARTIVEWAHDQGIEDVCFHQYSPIQNSFEVVPTASDLMRMRSDLSDWVARTNSSMTVLVDGSPLNPKAAQDRRTKSAHNEKRRIAFSPRGPGNMFPTTIGTVDADPLWTCAAPYRTLDIGLDAQIGACCRAQDVALGYASSVPAFADAWLGPDYARLRASLDRSAAMPFPLPNCKPCIDFYAPAETRGRTQVDYSRAREFPLVLVLGHLDRIALASIQKEQGFCYIARIPPTANFNEYRLYEGDEPLGPGGQLHDDIRRDGRGRFSIWGSAVYFSSSDNSDPRRNQRAYSLRRDNDAKPRC